MILVANISFYVEKTTIFQKKMQFFDKTAIEAIFEGLFVILFVNLRRIRQGSTTCLDPTQTHKALSSQL